MFGVAFEGDGLVDTVGTRVSGGWKRNKEKKQWSTRTRSSWWAWPKARWTIGPKRSNARRAGSFRGAVRSHLRGIFIRDVASKSATALSSPHFGQNILCENPA